jgi:hypothetical protein
MKTPGIIWRHSLSDDDPRAGITSDDGRVTIWPYARPLPFYSWRTRWKAAWLVFTGRADALRWNGDPSFEETVRLSGREQEA